MAEKLPQREVDHAPLCPHCEKEIHEVHFRQMQTMSFYEYVYMCPHCQKVIGIGAATR